MLTKHCAGLTGRKFNSCQRTNNVEILLRGGLSSRLSRLKPTGSDFWEARDSVRDEFFITFPLFILNQAMIRNRSKFGSATATFLVHEF